MCNKRSQDCIVFDLSWVRVRTRGMSSVALNVLYMKYCSYIQMVKYRRQKTFLAYVTGKLCKMHRIFSRRAAASSRYHQHTLHDLSLNPWESPSKLLSCWAEQLEHLTANLFNPALQSYINLVSALGLESCKQCNKVLHQAALTIRTEDWVYSLYIDIAFIGINLAVKVSLWTSQHSVSLQWIQQYASLQQASSTSAPALKSQLELEPVLITHESGHQLSFSHPSVWGWPTESAISQCQRHEPMIAKNANDGFAFFGGWMDVIPGYRWYIASMNFFIKGSRCWQR